jgi:hypothetical protein
MSIVDKPMKEACVNPDGETYDGRKLVRWLFEATTGKPMSHEEAEQLVAEAKLKAEEKRRSQGR